jgi:hypothetical protein
MKPTKEISRIFEDFPEAPELYIDANGQVWTTKEAAAQQSKGANIEIIKRTNKKQKSQ